MFPRLFGGRNKDELNDDNPSYDNQQIPEHSSVTSHSSTGVMSGDQDATEPLNMSLNPNNPPQLPPRPGEGGAAGGAQAPAQGGGAGGVQGGAHGGARPRDGNPHHGGDSIFNLQKMWDTLSAEDKQFFIERNRIPNAPPKPLSYEAELKSEQSDLEEDMQLIEEEEREINDQIDVNHQELNLLSEQKSMSKRRTALIEERKKAIEKARIRNKNALDLETQRKFRELRKGKMKESTEDDLQDLIGNLVRKELAKLALNSKAAKMREGAREEDPLPSASIPGPSQTLYADLMRNRNSPNLIDLQTQSEEDNPGRQDDFPSLPDNRRKKKKVQIATGSGPNLDDFESQSLVSVGSSLFESNPVSVLLFKLKKRHKSAVKAMREYPDQIKVLELEKDGITRLLQAYEAEVGKLENVGPAERDELTNLADQLEEDQLQIVLLLSKIHKSIEDKKNNARPVFPKFTGTYTDFNNFQKEIDAAMTHLEDAQKKTAYKNAAIQGINKEEITMLLANCETYSDMKN